MPKVASKAFNISEVWNPVCCHGNKTGLLYRVFIYCLPAASSASSASLSTNVLLSSLVIFLTSWSNSEYFLLSWSRTRSDWVEFIHCLTPLLVSFFFPGLPLYPFLVFPHFKSKDLLSRCLKCLIKGVNVDLVFFPQDLKAVLQLLSKSLSDPVISQFTGIELLSPSLSSVCPTQLQ